jgi:hypothetical protein
VYHDKGYVFPQTFGFRKNADSHPDCMFSEGNRHTWRIEQGNQWRVNGGQQRLLLKAGKPVVTDIFTDDHAGGLSVRFLLHETVVVFLVVSGAGEGEGFLSAS